MFLWGAGRRPATAESSVNILLTFVRWPESQLPVNDNAAVRRYAAFGEDSEPVRRFTCADVAARCFYTMT